MNRERAIDRQCPAHWPDDWVEHQDGRRCRFLLTETEDGWECPAHGIQSVPEPETQNNVPETEQVALGEVRR